MPEVASTMPLVPVWMVVVLDILEVREVPGDWIVLSPLFGEWKKRSQVDSTDHQHKRGVYRNHCCPRSFRALDIFFFGVAKRKEGKEKRPAVRLCVLSSPDAQPKVADSQPSFTNQFRQRVARRSFVSTNDYFLI